MEQNLLFNDQKPLPDGTVMAEYVYAKSTSHPTASHISKDINVYQNCMLIAASTSLTITLLPCLTAI